MIETYSNGPNLHLPLRAMAPHAFWVSSVHELPQFLCVHTLPVEVSTMKLEDVVSTLGAKCIDECAESHGMGRLRALAIPFWRWYRMTLHKLHRF